MYTFKDFLGGKKLDEIAAKGEGRYASAREINAKSAKNIKCSCCGGAMNKDNSYSVGGKNVCATCKGQMNEDATAQQTQLANLNKQINDMNSRLQRLLQQKTTLERQMQSQQQSQQQQTQTNQQMAGQAPGVGGPAPAPNGGGVGQAPSAQ